MKTQINKPMFVLVSLIALALTGCGKTNSAATTPNNVYPQGGTYPPGTYPPGTVPGVLGCQPFQGAGYIDSANIYVGQGASQPNYGYPSYYGSASFQYQGSGSDGTMVVQGTMQGNNSANMTIQLSLSQLVVADIQRQMAYSGMYNVPISGCTIAAVNIGHTHSTVYGGGFGGGRAVLIMVNGNFPYYVHF